MNWFESIQAYFNELGGAVNTTIDKGNQIITSISELNSRIQSLTQFVENVQSVSHLILVAMAVQFVVILWMWAGQSAMKKELAEIKTAVKGSVKNGQQGNCG